VGAAGAMGITHLNRPEGTGVHAHLAFNARTVIE
jgi:hypothetical protein